MDNADRVSWVPRVFGRSRLYWSHGVQRVRDSGAHWKPDAGGNTTVDVSMDATPLDASGDIGGLCEGIEWATRRKEAGERASCGCTRRPGPGASSSCPVGIGESTSASIGPERGNSGHSGAVKRWRLVSATQLNFGAGTIAATTELSLAETTIVPPHDLA